VREGSCRRRDDLTEFPPSGTPPPRKHARQTCLISLPWTVECRHRAPCTERKRVERAAPVARLHLGAIKNFYIARHPRSIHATRPAGACAVSSHSRNCSGPLGAACALRVNTPAARAPHKGMAAYAHERPRRASKQSPSMSSWRRGSPCASAAPSCTRRRCSRWRRRGRSAGCPSWGRPASSGWRAARCARCRQRTTSP